jgi:hypothetical protein
MGVVVAVSVVPSMFVGVGVAAGMRVSVHCDKSILRACLPGCIPKSQAVIGNFDNKPSEFVDALTRDCHYHTRAHTGRMGGISSAHLRDIQAPRKDR